MDSSYAGTANNLDAADQGISNGHRLYRTSLNHLFLPGIYLPVHHVHRNHYVQGYATAS